MRSVRYIPILISLIIASLSPSDYKAVANSERDRSPTINPSSTPVSLKFKLPPRGAPGTRKGAAARDSCLQSAEQLTALIPGTNLGLTVTERPTFWFYIPHRANEKYALEFTLKYREQNQVYQTTLPWNNNPGIIEISLPESISPLEIDKFYSWQLKLDCDSKKSSDYRLVKGRVQRVTIAPELQNKIATATPKERVQLYAESGLWFDTLTNLIELRNLSPEDKQLEANWIDLLEEVNLEEIIDKPIVYCCETKQ